MNTLSGKKIRIITVILTYSLAIARNSTFICVRIKAAILNKKVVFVSFTFSSKIGHLFLSCSTTCRTFYWSCFTEWAAARKSELSLTLYSAESSPHWWSEHFSGKTLIYMLENVTRCLNHQSEIGHQSVKCS